MYNTELTEHAEEQSLRVRHVLRSMPSFAKIQATYVPARRAARVDPIVALRAD